jgi:hypothetical protein
MQTCQVDIHIAGIIMIRTYQDKNTRSGAGLNETMKLEVTLR